MKLKTKISLGLAFLFSVIVVISFLAIYYLQDLNRQNQNLLHQNYRSLGYVHQLEKSLNEIRNGFQPTEDSRVRLERLDYRINPALDNFSRHLERLRQLEGSDQEEIITEIQAEFDALSSFIAVTRTKDYYFEKIIPLIQGLNQKINQVYQLHQQAISHRSEMASATAQRVIYTLAIILAVCIIITLSFIIGFPRVVAEPVEKLAAAIHRIKEGDYTTRVHIDTRDEYGALGKAFNQMAERIHHYEQLNLQKLMAEKTRMETMVQKLSEGIIGLDEEFNILFLNPFACKALGIKQDDITGLSAKDLSLKSELWQSIISDLVEHAATGKRYTRNKLVKGQLKDKPAYFIRKVIISTPPARETPEYIIMLKNITEYKEQDEARTNFIATVSHELKTPISSMKMSLKLLRDQRLSQLNEEQQELVESIEWEVSRLLNITQELLNANEVETGRLQLHPEMLPLTDIVDEAIDSVMPLAEDRQISIEEHIPDSLPLFYVDENKLTWVLINLLTNAIKYSPVGSPVVLQAKTEGKDLLLSVTDKGKGIPPHEQDKIFERYYRISGSAGKGTGLGLSISREIVQLMDGHIGVESRPGEGARFYIRLRNIRTSHPYPES